jgi:hypothetical protein
MGAQRVEGEALDAVGNNLHPRDMFEQGEDAAAFGGTRRLVVARYDHQRSMMAFALQLTEQPERPCQAIVGRAYRME